MRMFLYAAALVAAALCAPLMATAPASAQVTTYLAVAANNAGYGVGRGFTMEQARQNAIDDCERNTGRSCRYMTTAERAHWHFIVVNCNGIFATGASQQNWNVANTMAARKVGFNWCNEVDRL